MIELSDLWIGDLLRLQKSGRVGKFEGIKNNKAKVNVNGKIVLSSPANLEFHTEIIADTFIEKPKLPFVQEIPFNRVIDLHIETLNPSLITNRAERIIDFQTRAAKDHIENGINRNVSSIEIIHGKGTGVLKSEVLHLISLYDEIRYHVPTRGGGGVEILFI